jgi:hypothetical protein
MKQQDLLQNEIPYKKKQTKKSLQLEANSLLPELALKEKNANRKNT